MEHNVSENLNSISTQILDQIASYGMDLNHNTNLNVSDTNNIKQQISQLNQEKLKLQQSIIVLNTNIEGLESFVGLE